MASSGGQQGAAWASTDGAVHEATCDSQGYYSIAGIDPGQVYVVDVDDADGVPLSRNEVLGKLTAGREFIWNHTIRDAIVLKGRVHGIMAGTPLAGVRVCCTKAGERTPGISRTEQTKTTPDGAYEFQILAGPGGYVVAPKYLRVGVGHSDEPENVYAQEIELTAGQVRQLDLSLLDPCAFSFRVLTDAGRPAADAAIRCREQWLRASVKWRYPDRTDADGRVRISGLAPGAEFTFTFTYNDYCPAQSVPDAAQPGEEVPEQVIVLYPRSGLAAVLVDDAGAPLANAKVHVAIYYGDDQTTYLDTRTDAYGRLDLRGDVPATRIVLAIDALVGAGATSRRLTYVSDAVDCAEGRVTELGEIELLDKPATR
ncbi:MAG TPA: hypothetical protein HPP83_08350 [Candidatus Hydrogenedentes bacterium]|nr:hypothetical protein [Candidatus Hydrogenedentota bacterium]